jgi:exodeoxyribonuclease V gamma subunit
VELVALTVAHPGRAWCAVTVGRGRKPATALRSCLGPLTADEAELSIVEMVALYRAGLRAPLPLPVKTAGQYAFLRGKGTGVPAARVGAADKWTSGTYPGEQADAEHALVYGPNAPMSVLTDQPPGEGESGAGWPPDETDRFGLLARRLWGRLLAAETEQP